MVTYPEDSRKHKTLKTNFETGLWHLYKRLHKNINWRQRTIICCPNANHLSRGLFGLISHLIPPTLTTTGISPAATTGSDDKDFPGHEEGREVSFIVMMISNMTKLWLFAWKLMKMAMRNTSASPFLTGPLWCRPRVALPDKKNSAYYQSPSIFTIINLIDLYHIH